MNRNPVHSAVIMVVILLAIVACVLPGQPIPPAPVTTPINIETAVAGTAQAAAQQTQLANPVLPTATVASTDTPTATPKVSTSGTSLMKLADGSTQFTDYVAGMQMTLPSHWLVVRVGEEEYYKAWGLPETQNPEFVDIFANIQNVDPKVFRMTGLDVRADHFLFNDVTQVDVVFDEGDTRTLEQLKSDEKKNHPRYKKYKLLSSQAFETSQGLRAVSMEEQWATSNGASQTGLGYRRRVMFKVPGGSMAVDVNIVLDKKDLVMPDFDQLINSIILLAPPG